MADNEGTQTTDSGADDVEVTTQQGEAAVAGQGGSVEPGGPTCGSRTAGVVAHWVADATGQPVEQITDDRPMEEFGLASRDAVALGGDIEELAGVMLTATVVYQHPTIASLAESDHQG